jgi:hypothetical protein
MTSGAKNPAKTFLEGWVHLEVTARTNFYINHYFPSRPLFLNL